MYRLLLCNIIFALVISTNNYAQSVRDSLDTLILQQESAKDQIRTIINLLDNSTLSSKEDINYYFEKGNTLCIKSNNHDLSKSLRIRHARSLALIGEKKAAMDSYKIVQKIAENDNDSISLSAVLLGQAAFYAEEGKIDRAKEILYKTINLLKNSTDIKTRISPYNQLSNILRNEGQYHKAQNLLDTVISLTKNDSTSISLFSAYSSKGRIYRFQGKNDSAKLAYKTAEKLALKSAHQLSLAVIYNNLGNIEHVEGNYAEALEYYLKSLSIKEKAGDVRGTSIAYHNIGAILVEMKDWQKALSYFNKSNLSANKINYKLMNVHNENKIGEVFAYDSLYQQAIVHHKKALDVANDINFQKGKLSALYNLGNDFLLINDFDSCNKYLVQGLTLARELKSKSLESSILVKLAEAYLKDESQNNNPDSVKEFNRISQINIYHYLLDAKRMADEMNNANNKLLALQGLDLYYSKTKNTSANLRTLREYNSLKDSLFAEDRMNALADWETKYETAEKEKEIIELENKNKISALKAKQFRLGVLGFGLILSIIGGFVYYYLRQRNKKQEEQKRELFRAKLSSDLHDDVGSTLTGLAMQSELLSNFVEDNLKESAINISNLSREAMTRMRDTVWAIDSRKDKLSDLINRMQDFAQSNLSTKDIVFSLHQSIDNINKKIEPEVRQNIYLIFKECIANILKHSNADKVNAIFKTNNKIITLEISDNGTIDKSKITTSGVGVQSIRDRAKSLGGTVNISHVNGYTVIINIPQMHKKI